VLPGDAAELAAVAFRGGVAHTPGYPTYVLLGQVAGALLPGDPSHRIALLSSFMGAVSVGLFALVLAEFGLAWGALLAGALALGGTFTLWWSAIRVEVYTTGLALALFALWRVMVARRTLRARDGLLAAFAIGLAMTVHLSFGVLLALAGLSLAVRAQRAGASPPRLRPVGRSRCSSGSRPTCTCRSPTRATRSPTTCAWRSNPRGASTGSAPSGSMACGSACGS
jgi:hypothetical protein